MFSHVCVHLYRGVQTCVCTYGGQRSSSAVLHLRQSVSQNPELPNAAKASYCPRDPLSRPPKYRDYMWAAMVTQLLWGH